MTRCNYQRLSRARDESGAALAATVFGDRTEPQGGELAMEVAALALHHRHSMTVRRRDLAAPEARRPSVLAEAGRRTTRNRCQRTFHLGDRFRGEVRWALSHPTGCVLGVLSNVKFTEDEVDLSSGTFTLYDRCPDEGELDPREYDWTPSSEKVL